ncbi:MAG TPA: hypothetical protein VG795_11915 [Acidimicrobiia bacterium]|nr:hypothetical protein [Acidimicrobiia bacterium]
MSAGMAVLTLVVTACGAENSRESPASAGAAAAAEDGPAVPPLPPGVRKAKGLDPGREVAANRALRGELPEVPGAQLVDVSDRYVIEGVSESDWSGDEEPVAVGVETVWRYRIDGVSKCRIADAFEGPIAATGWSQLTTQAPGPDGMAFREIRFSKPGALLIVNVDAPPTTFGLRVQAHTKDLTVLSGPPTSPYVPCRSDLPLPPPDTPAERAAALAANHSIYRKLPIPAGATLVEETPEAATVFGNGNVPIGYGSQWKLRLPAGTELCAVAAAFDAAMAKAGWERFTEGVGAGRSSDFYTPPRWVEVTLTPQGDLYVLVMGDGAVVGTQQYPSGHQFEAGATPESRGQPVACTLG